MRRLHDLWRRGRRVARTTISDSELLDRFVRSGDHAAFAELVDRLGPVVYGACRRLLPNPADVEDAFQAAFLVLVRRADTLTGRAVGPWLHRVAVWTARNFRRRNATTPQPLDAASLPGSQPGLAASDARLDIDAAVSALPEKYRVAVILCHLQGWTRHELAAHLGCPESTASSLVGRGLAKLKKRLAGGDPAMVLAVAGAATVPSGLAASAVRAACLYRTSSLAAAASPAVAELTEGVLRMFRMKKLVAGLAAAVTMVGLGIGLTLGDGPRAEAQAPQPSPPAAPADDAKAQRDKLDKEIEAAKERVKQLEKERARLERQEAFLKQAQQAEAEKTRLEQQEKYQQSVRRAYERLAQQRANESEPYIGLWVRPPGSVAGFSGGPLNINDSDASVRLLNELMRTGLGGGPGSEFAINEIYGKGKPVVEVHFYDVRSLQVYLTRAAKDPTAPKKLKLDIDKEYPAAKVKPVLDACKAAGFKTIELVSAPPGGPGRDDLGTAIGVAGLGVRIPTDEAFLRSVDARRGTITVWRIVSDGGVEVAETVFTLRTDAYLFDEATGKRREWTDLKTGERLRLYLSTHEGGSQGMPVLKVGIVARAKTDPMRPYLIEPPDVLRIDVELKEGEKSTSLLDEGADQRYLVRPDGTIALGRHGAVKVTGLEAGSAANAIRTHLLGLPAVKDKVSRPEDVLITLDVIAYNSKHYFVITDDGKSESVHRFPLTANETVSNAIAQIGGASAVGDSQVTIARPGSDGQPEQVLTVDLAAIRDGRRATNYQLMAGDRVLVKMKK